MHGHDGKHRHTYCDGIVEWADGDKEKDVIINEK